MTNQEKMFFRNSILTVLLIWVAYTALTLLTPASEATSRFHISQTQINLLRLTILVPYLFIWLAGAIAAARFYNYAKSVSNSPEGPGFTKFSWGMWLVFVPLIISALINSTSGFYSDTTAVQKTSVIVRNILNVGFYLTAYWLMFRGSRQLAYAVGYKDNMKQAYIIAGIVAVLTIVYTWAIFQNDYRTVSDNPLVRPTYYLPDWLIVLTVLIPNILTWLVGSLAIAYITGFSNKVKGIIYSQAFKLIGRGLITIISLSIAMQFLTQFGVIFTGSGIGLILAIVYVILFIIAIGYLLIARGASKLSKIEEV